MRDISNDIYEYFMECRKCHHTFLSGQMRQWLKANSINVWVQTQGGNERNVTRSPLTHTHTRTHTRTHAHTHAYTRTHTHDGWFCIIKDVCIWSGSDLMRNISHSWLWVARFTTFCLFHVVRCNIKTLNNHSKTILMCNLVLSATEIW